MRIKMKTLLYSIILAFVFTGSFFPQKYWERRLKDYNNPDELVTMSQTFPFNELISYHSFFGVIFHSFGEKELMNAGK